MAGKGIEFKTVLNHDGKTVDRFAHIRRAQKEIYPSSAWYHYNALTVRINAVNRDGVKIVFNLYLEAVLQVQPKFWVRLADQTKTGPGFI